LTTNKEWNKKNYISSDNIKKIPPSWPNEMLTKILSSKAYSNITNALLEYPTCKAIEIGSGSGNNLRMMIDKGFEVTGTEINSNMLDICKENLIRTGTTIPHLMEATNLSIPFEDLTFDLLVSINTLHYCSGENTLLAIREFSRVLKPGGIAIIESAGPSHFAVQEASRNAPLDWTWNSHGFRVGSKMGFFDDETHFKDCLSNGFSVVELANRIEKYNSRNLEFMVAICKK